MPFHTQCAIRLDQYQSRVRTSLQPSTRSARNDRGGIGVRGTRITASMLALAANEAASRTNAQPGPAVKISRPATAGPASRVALAAEAISALARSIPSAGAVPLTRGPVVGRANAEAMPPTASAIAMSANRGDPPMSSAPTSSWAAHRTRSVASATLRASNRSAATPPRGSSSSRGTIAQPSTRASAKAEPSARVIAMASAAGTTASPRADRVRPVNRRRKARTRRGCGTPAEYFGTELFVNEYFADDA